MQGKPYRVVKTGKAWMSRTDPNTCSKAAFLRAQREVEGPFGEFPGYYSGGHRYPVIEIDRVSHRKNPIFESVYVGGPWTELDFLQAMTTSAPVFIQLSSMFPEVVAVNALYTHGLVLIVSTKVRYGGFAKSVGLGPCSRPHMGSDMPRSLSSWMPMSIRSTSTKSCGPCQCGQIGGRRSDHSEPCREPARSAGQPTGMAHKMIIDATTPVAPDRRGTTARCSTRRTDRCVAREAHRSDQSYEEMSEAMPSTSPPICPRCRSATHASAGQVARCRCWTVSGCDTCFYTWRSTEPEENTNPEKYPAVFRLNPADLGKLPAIRIFRRCGGPPAASGPRASPALRVHALVAGGDDAAAGVRWPALPAGDHARRRPMMIGTSGRTS